MAGQQRSYSTTDRVGRVDADGAGRSDGTRRLVPRARHQPLLREVNDRIAELAEWNEAGVSLFVCECSDLGCADAALEISAAEYARIRADESHFLVLPGHERPGQRVVERTDRFVVVADREPARMQRARTGSRRDG
jgi:hypothetical protein